MTPPEWGSHTLAGLQTGAVLQCRAFFRMPGTDRCRAVNFGQAVNVGHFNSHGTQTRQCLRAPAPATMALTGWSMAAWRLRHISPARVRR